MEQNQKTELLIREWILVALIIGFIMMLFSSAYLAMPSTFTIIQAPVNAQEETVGVFVKGSVQDPGFHRFAKGTTVEGVLSSVGVLPEGDITGRKLNAKIRANQVINIPAKKTPSKTRRRSTQKVEKIAKKAEGV